MQLKFAHRWSLLLLLVACLALLLSAVLSRWSLSRGFDDYLREAETERWQPLVGALQREYESDQWKHLRRSPRAFEQLLFNYGPRGAPPPAGLAQPEPPPPGQRRPGANSGPGSRPGPGPGLDPNARMQLPPRPPRRPPPPPTVVDDAGAYVAGDPRKRADSSVFRLPLLASGRPIGWLLLNQSGRLSDDLADDFLKHQLQIGYAIGAGLLLVFAIMAWWMSRQMGRPLQALGSAMRRLTRGDYAHRIDEGRGDEFGELAQRCNRLASTLQRSQQAQQRWLADIAHELRTPLTILRGELQAVEDDVRPFDQRMNSSLLAETQRLSSLVDDLRMLALSDEGGLGREREPLDLTALLTEVLDGFESRLLDRSIALQRDLSQQSLWVEADPGALTRMLVNLLENTCRYTDPGGILRVGSRRDGSHALLHLEDSAPSVPVASLPHLFERFYRVEESRNRALGGSGLGLAIVASIVAAHHGEVSASRSALGGLDVCIRLPLSRQGSSAA
jgi:two-component system sensor histidine kinase BaeS